MSWTDEEIDNLFRDGATNQSFEYDNSYFSEIEGALPVNRKGKDFLWMGTALVFIAVLTTGYFINNANDTSFNSGNNSQLANLELNTANENNVNTSNENEISTEGENTLINEIDAKDANNELSNSESSNSNANVNAVGSPNVNSTKSNSTASINVGNTEPLRVDRSNSMYNIATRNVGASRTNTVHQNVRNTSVNSVGTELQRSENQIAANARNSTADQIQRKFELESAPITASLGLNNANQLDQGLSRDVTSGLAMPPLGELRPKSAFYVELNAGISQSLITPSESMSRSYGGGIGVETYFGNLSLTTGLNFKASHHDDLYLTRTGKVYGFGSNIGTNEYDIQRIYSLEMPITLGYNLGRHNFNIGVRPSLVVGASAELQSFENDQLLRRSRFNGLIEQEVNGQMERALMQFGVKPTFGYSYRMNKWTIGANMGIQMMESVNEAYIDGVNNRFPIDGQIYFRRTISLRR